ncbi:MAG: MOSC domain-containing protein [Phycisphaerae bacterium]
MPSPTLVQINTSKGGMPKFPLPGPTRVTVDGVEGDWQKNRKYHGGPNRAICLFSEELYAALAEKGTPLLANGSVGENFTTRGLDLQQLKKGDRLHFGDEFTGVTIEITDVRVPCRNLKKWDEELPELIVGQSGWVCRVVKEGTVRAGDPIAPL